MNHPRICPDQRVLEAPDQEPVPIDLCTRRHLRWHGSLVIFPTAARLDTQCIARTVRMENQRHHAWRNRGKQTVPDRRTPRPGDKSSTSGRLLDSVDIVPERLLPRADLLLLQVSIVIGIIAARLLRFPGWHGAAFGAAVASIFLVRFHRLTLPQWATLRLRYLSGRRNKSRRVPLLAEPFDTEIGDGSQIGFRWDGKTLLSLLKIEENPQAMTVLEPGTTVSGEMLSIQLVAGCLRQFDIELDSIDVISQGARSHGHSPIAAIYDAVLGPLPAIAQRTVWVALRFDPSVCAEAVRRRGGGREGVLRTATTATRRVANRLIEAGLRPRVMTSSEIAYATNQLSNGVNLRNVDETWHRCKQGNFQLQSFSVKSTMLTTAGVGLLWTIPSYSTTVCVSLRRDKKHDLVKIRGLTRFDTHGRSQVYLDGLEEFPGQQFSALAATLPVSQPKRSVGRWAFGRGEKAFDNLALPASGCGQVIGADAQGRAVALPLFGPQIRRVEICGELHLAQQVLLRSLALGARVRVHTSRPAAWWHMVEKVGDRGLLWVADSGRGSIQAGSDRNYSVEMFDGLAAQSVRVGVTVMVLQAPHTEPSEHCDVVLELLDGTTDTVKVSTSSGSAVVTIVATDEELRFVKTSVGGQR
ncbi:type VII secretion protein EccE [Mycobacterium heidelbergense]|uniref:type VII secretion protein EccE n=1 Tax=Mycobacterium heidelbergense TaxID=53376 RepID=UPI003CE8FB01